MVREALTGYWSLVSGLTEVTGKRARKAAKALAEQGDASRSQVTALAQEIAETSRANREALVKLVRYEAERAAGRLGFASSDEVSTLQGRIRELERTIAELRVAADAVTPAPAPAATAPARSRAAAKAPTRTARKAAAKAPGAAKAASATKATKATSATKATKATSATKATRATKATKATKAADATKASRASGTAGTAGRATPRRRTADAAGATGPGSPS